MWYFSMTMVERSFLIQVEKCTHSTLIPFINNFHTILLLKKFSKVIERS